MKYLYIYRVEIHAHVIINDPHDNYTILIVESGVKK